MTERLAVIGGDAGGATAASRARRRRSADELDVVIFERGAFTSYAACGIPYFVGALVPGADELVARTPEQHRASGIDVRTGHEVLAIDLDRRVLRVRDLAGGGEADEAFDRLVVATGATPTRPPIDGIDLPGVYGVQHLDEGIALRQAVDDRGPERAVVVGAGYIGLEMAEALVMRGLHVTVVDPLPQPMSTLDRDMGALVADAMRAVGVDLRTGTRVEGMGAGPTGWVATVETSDGVIPTDLVVLGLGVRPNTALAAAAGIEIGPTRGIATDDHMQTSAGGVYAAGDCVQTRHRVTGRPVAIALGTHANKQGLTAGVNATGGDMRFPGVIGTAVSKICKYEVARTGLGEAEARDAGFDVDAAAIDGRTRAGYFPGAAPIRVKLVWERSSGRLLGGQIVGEEGAAKRIDVLAACVWNEMTVQEIQLMDLSYAPPFAPVWDPVLAAARHATGRLSPSP